MSKDRLLITRWTEALTLSTAQALSAGAMESPFGSLNVEGRALHDFRGLNLDPHLLLQHPIQGVHLLDADFSGAIIGTLGNLKPVHIEGCRFDRARFEGNLGVQVIGSSFRAARLEHVQLYLSSSFSDCDFSTASLIDARAYDVDFIRCRFDEANLRDARLTSCVFDTCSWQKVRFKGTSLAESWITRPGFPGPFDEQESLLTRPMPTLILEQVHWMDPADPDSLLTGSIRQAFVAAGEMRLREEREACQIPLLSIAREAFRQGDYARAITSLDKAAELCPLPSSGLSLRELARKRLPIEPA